MKNTMTNKSDDVKKKKKSSEFRYVQTESRSRYFPNHKSALSRFLSRFQSKINDIRFFLNNPTLPRTELASRNRLWCVCCDADIDELDSSFACENTIKHLVGADHLKSLKHFLWKHGGGMDRVDAFRISEADVDKNYTNEYRVSFSGHYGSNMGTHTASSVYTETCPGASLRSVNNLTVNTNSQQSIHGNSRGCVENGHRSEGMIHQVSQDGRMVIGESTF